MNMRMRQLGSQARRMALFAAATLGLIAAVNLAILVTAAWNRSAPDAELVLTEREIAARDGLFSEDSGRFVRLRIRQQDKCGAFPCEPSWLDEAKRAELDIRPDVPRKDEGMKRALLVLELRDGEPGDGEARESRLFLADAGLDAHALRRRHPDRTRYAVTPGLLRCWTWRDAEGKSRPHCSAALERESLFVPLDFADDFAALKAGRPVTLRLAFGRRLTPWVKELRANIARLYRN